jgi:hypothetical protein
MWSPYPGRVRTCADRHPYRRVSGALIHTFVRNSRIGGPGTEGRTRSCGRASGGNVAGPGAAEWWHRRSSSPSGPFRKAPAAGAERVGAHWMGTGDVRYVHPSAIGCRMQGPPPDRSGPSTLPKVGNTPGRIGHGRTARCAPRGARRARRRTSKFLRAARTRACTETVGVATRLNGSVNAGSECSAAIGWSSSLTSGVPIGVARRR